MIKILQKKFVFTAMTAITVLIVLLLGTVNVVNIVSIQQEVSRTLEMIMDNDGDPGNALPGQNGAVPEQNGNSAEQSSSTSEQDSDLSEQSSSTSEQGSSTSEQNNVLPEQGSAPPQAMNGPKNEYDTIMSSNYFLVRMNAEGESVYADTSRTSAVSETEAKAFAEEVYAEGSESGKVGKFRYLLRADKIGEGTTAVFLDISDENFSYIRVLLLSLLIGVICWGAMLLFVILLSRKAIRPIAENIEKQKQFVTNAGHEIKTPLAIIQSNTEAMELYNGENKWSKNIKAQTVRLGDLMKQLLLLARMDEGTAKTKLEEFNVSRQLTELLQGFLQPAEEKKITVHREIAEDISLCADQGQIEQLFSILLDNAVKYTNEGGQMWVRLKKEGKRVQLEFQNTCESLPDAAPEKLFDRFYRGDAARTQKSGGYGIGLSMAQTIVQANKGTIRACYSDPDSISFEVSF